MLTFYGTDNQIDGIVIDVLIRKHKTIRNSLGISVPVPVDTNQVIEAIFEGLLLVADQARPQSRCCCLRIFSLRTAKTCTVNGTPPRSVRGVHAPCSRRSQSLAW